MNSETRADLSRKEKQRRWHRRLMIEAAEQLFSHQGYHATSMQEIAEAAEFSVGSLYKMFDSKEDLYRQIVQSRTEQYCKEAYARMEEESNPADKIRAVIDCKLDFFDDHRQFFRIFTNFMDASGPDSRPAVSAECMKPYREYQNRLSDIFAAGIRKGTFRQCDPSLMVLALEGTTNAIIGRWIHTRESKLESVDPRVIENILFQGLARKETC